MFFCSLLWEKGGSKISPFFLLKKIYYFCKMDYHYIEIITKLKKENDKLRSSLYELLKSDKIPKTKKDLIIKKHFNNGKEQI